jgi:hypothetical protein
MPDAKIDWPGVARNLAAHLLVIGDVDVARRIVDDAARDAVALSAPASWWDLVAREYAARKGSSDEARQILEMICSQASRPAGE